MVVIRRRSLGSATVTKQYFLPKSGSTWRHISPIWNRIKLHLSSIGAIAEANLPVGDLVAGCAFFYEVPRAQCVLVLQLSAFVARQRDHPMRAVDFRQHGCARIPLWE